VESFVVNNATSDGGRLAASGCFLWVSFVNHLFFNSLFRDYSFLLDKFFFQNILLSKNL